MRPKSEASGLCLKKQSLISPTELERRARPHPPIAQESAINASYLHW